MRRSGVPGHSPQPVPPRPHQGASPHPSSPCLPTTSQFSCVHRRPPCCLESKFWSVLCHLYLPGPSWAGGAWAHWAGGGEGSREGWLGGLEGQGEKWCLETEEAVGVWRSGQKSREGHSVRRGEVGTHIWGLCGTTSEPGGTAERIPSASPNAAGPLRLVSSLGPGDPVMCNLQDTSRGEKGLHPLSQRQNCPKAPP